MRYKDVLHKRATLDKTAGPRPSEKATVSQSAQQMRNKFQKEYGQQDWWNTQKGRQDIIRRNAYNQGMIQGFGEHFTDPRSYRDWGHDARTWAVNAVGKIPSAPFRLAGYAAGLVNTGVNGAVNAARLSWAGRNGQRVDNFQPTYRNYVDIFTPMANRIDNSWVNTAARGIGQLATMPGAMGEALLYKDPRMIYQLPQYTQALQQAPGGTAVMGALENAAGDAVFSMGMGAAKNAIQAPKWSRRINYVKQGFRPVDPITHSVKPRTWNPVQAWKNRQWLDMRRAQNVSTRLNKQEFATLPKRSIRDMFAERGVPGNVNVYWRDSPTIGDAGYVPAENLITTIDKTTSLANRAGGRTAVSWSRGPVATTPEAQVTPTSMLWHEMGHAKAHANGNWVPYATDGFKSTSTPDLFRYMFNPDANPVVANERAADAIFGPSRLVQMRHHPTIVNYRAGTRVNAFNELLKRTMPYAPANGAPGYQGWVPTGMPY